MLGRVGLLLAASLCASAQLQEPFTVEQVAANLKYADGPVWSLEDFLLFSDTAAGTQHKLVSGKPMMDVPAEGGANGNAYDTKGNLYTCESHARQVVRIDKKGKREVVAGTFEGKRFNAPNDVVVRKDGNVYFTDPAFGSQEDTRELDFNGVFRVTSKGEVQAVARWMTRPGGVALAPNGRTLYVSNADEGSVWAFDLDRGGEASNGRVVIPKIPGVPEGLRTDEDGNLYVAAKAVYIYSPEGELLRTLELPETPSNLAWGDPDFRSLYVTAHTSVFRVRLGVLGAVPYFQ